MNYREIERRARQETTSVADCVAMEMRLRAGALAAGALPCDVWRYPPGCPDSDWCAGNRMCFWRCQADPDEDLQQECA